MQPQAAPQPGRLNMPWLACSLPRPQARVRLVCLPYAGGGAAAFWPWSEDLGPQVEVWAVQLPGRERRFAEAPLTSMGDVVPPIADAIAARIQPPFALYGHSMGGLLALETARTLQRRGGPAPVRLFASGTRAPHLPPIGDAHTFDDHQLEKWLVSLGGLPEEVRADRQLLGMIMPTIRADLELCGRYEHHPQAPLTCPIVTFAGADDPLAPAEDVAGWASHTAAGFGLIVLPGDHFFLHRHRRSLTAAIARALLDQIEDRAGGSDRPTGAASTAEGVRQR